MPVPASTFSRSSVSLGSLPGSTQASIEHVTLREAQLEIDALKAQIRQLQDENAELEAQVQELDVAKKAKGKGNSEESPKEIILKISKRFVIEGALWIPPACFQEKPALPSSHPTYFRDPNSTILGYAAEIYEATPPALHPMLSLPSTGHLFCVQGMNQKRPNLLKKLKDVAPNIFHIIGITREALRDRKQSPEILRFLKRDVDAEGYPPLAPILYPLDNAANKNAIFMNPVLPLIYRVAVFTGSALDGAPAANSDGHKWGVKVVTPGGIAMSAIMACFLLSIDPSLAPIGTKTNIKYEDNFNYYRRLLQGLRSTPYWPYLTQWYQRHVFYDISPSSINPTTLASEQNPNVNTDEDFTRAIANAVEVLQSPASSQEPNNSTRGERHSPSSSPRLSERSISNPFANMRLDPEEESQVLIPWPPDAQEALEDFVPSNLNIEAAASTSATPASFENVENVENAPRSNVKGRGRGRGRGRGKGRVVSEPQVSSGVADSEPVRNLRMRK